MAASARLRTRTRALALRPRKTRQSRNSSCLNRYRQSSHSFFVCIRQRNRYLNLRRPEHLSVPLVASAINLKHSAFRNGFRRLRLNRVHAARVERLAEGANLASVEIVQQLIQTLKTQFVSSYQSRDRRFGTVAVGPGDQAGGQAGEPPGAMPRGHLSGALLR